MSRAMQFRESTPFFPHVVLGFTRFHISYKSLLTNSSSDPGGIGVGI